MTVDDPRPLTRRELSEFLPSQRAIRAFEKLFDLVPSEFIEILTALEELQATILEDYSSSARIAGILKRLEGVENSAGVRLDPRVGEIVKRLDALEASL